MALTRVAQLADLEPEEIEAWFAREDPERIVALVDAAGDDELARLVELEHLRRAAVREVLSRLEEFAIPHRLAEVAGTVAFEVALRKGRHERHAVALADGRVEPVDPETAVPDVTIRLGGVEFLRLVTGGENAAILLLGARLAVEGDTELALRVGGVFSVPGRPGVAVDPDTVDPTEVARVLKGVKDAHLRTVMAGGFRDVVIGQVFKRFPEFLVEERARRADLSVGFRITGRADGEADRYVVRVTDGTCEVEPDGDARDATLVLDGASFLKLVTGHLNPVLAVMRGAIKVRGDMAAGLALHRMMRIPGQA